MEYICLSCNNTYRISKDIFRCECGGMLSLNNYKPIFDPCKIDTDEWSMFRYRHALPILGDNWKNISLGEGMTPLKHLDSKRTNVLLKVDYIMPTLSFKDRGAIMVMIKALELGVKNVVQDSSGNAGNSVAAYAARAGIDCHIYVSATTSNKKIEMISSHGAEVHIIDGSREDVAKAALNAVENSDVFYASHVYNPFFYQGTKTYIYEIYEQTKGKMPDVLFIPLGNGTLLLGCYYGLKDLKRSGLISNYPKVVAVQANGCAPIYEAYKKNILVKEIKNIGTQAEGIAIANPMRGNGIISAIKEIEGDIITAPEDKINSARKFLAHKGYYVEPTTAATFAGFEQYANENDEIRGQTVIIPLCGAGIKNSQKSKKFST